MLQLLKYCFFSRATNDFKGWGRAMDWYVVDP